MSTVFETTYEMKSNLRRALGEHPPPHVSGGGGGGSGGGSSSSSSSGSSSSSSSSSVTGSSSGNTSANAASAAGTVAMGGKMGWNAALIAAAIAAGLAALLLAAFFMRRRKKSQNRGPAILEDEEATVASSTVVAPILYQPTGGRYQSLNGADRETEFEFKFVYGALAGHNDPNKYYKVVGQGFQKNGDDEKNFVSVDIVEGYVAKDGSSAYWVEERRPFASTSGCDAVCPKPKCGKGCFNADAGVGPSNGMEDGDVARVRCEGAFDFEFNTFEGQWTSNQGAGAYQLALRGIPPKTSAQPKTLGDEQSTPFRKRVADKFLSMFRRNR